MKQYIFNYTSLVFLVTTTLIIGLYAPMIFDLNNHVFSPSGDGIKNYYTYMYHAKYDTNFWDFSGMNYPFQEHIVYTDAQPLLSYLIKVFGLTNYGVGIMNFLMLIAFPIASIFNFKILKHYGIQSLWAVVSSICITFMAPQLFRLTGHLSLSYSFAIPLMWYLLLKISAHESFKYTIILFFSLFIAFFTHPYLGLIMSVFGLAYALVFWWFEKSKWRAYLSQIVTPILLVIFSFQLLVNLTDKHVDRMKSPSGFFEYYASWKSLLSPHHGPMEWLKNAFGFKMPDWETWTYLGLFTILSMLFAIIFYGLNRKEISFVELLKSPFGKIYLVGHIVLLFSFCFPLKFDVFRPLVEAIGPLKQFRVLGRFAWVYFYVVSVGSIVFIQFLLQRYPAKNKLIKTVYWVGIVFTVLEFLPAHIGVSKSISRSKSPFQQENLSQELRDLITWTKTQDYDAILFIPFTHLSSENIFILGSEKGNFDAMMLSYHCQLPLLNTITSRTSVSESVFFHNLFSPAYIEKKLFDVMGKDKKIMLVKNKSALNYDELRMVWAMDTLYTNANYKVFDFSNDTWNNHSYFEEKLVENKKAQHVLKDDWRSDSADVWFMYDGFETLSEKNSMLGKGAFAGQKDKITVIKDGITDLDNGLYRCSFWYNFRIDRADQMVVVELKFTSGKGKWVAKQDVRESNLIVGDWARVSVEFEVSDTVESTKLFLSNTHSSKWFVIDELLIQKVGDPALFKEAKVGEEDYLIYNNDWMNRQSFSE
ncbi:hypothetical protein DNU06_12075 [Putridiphycobacter roseus]|uniref:DUF6311 domain-containing protein n=1 Tax=Putridiphycobacter roseus TaxID=2219161 RepID=A0A2W1MYW3_9FLAO|nr:hypothetical protein [Putridiphycobacter roseus]PZE16584.1 hypothetical protein DNU06_12075 [Putridiphycobacter roseus]